MASKLFLVLALSFAIVLLISSDVTAATDFTEQSSTINGNTIDRDDGHRGGHGHGGADQGQGCQHCPHGCCNHRCCHYAGEAEAEFKLHN